MLIVEDGSGVPDADSYVDAIEARDIAARYGITLPVDNDELEVNARLAYFALDAYEPKLQGERTFEKQTGVFPRYGIAADADEITFNMKLAQLWQMDAQVKGLDNNAINTGSKLSGFSVDGVYSETYQSGSTSYANPVIQGVNNALCPYLKSVRIGITREFENLII